MFEDVHIPVLGDERVEAAARAMWERTPRKDDPTWADLDYGIKEIWRKDARAALAAADAVVTEEMIAETILKALVFTNENSEVWADGLARDITALFRGGAK